MSNKPKNTLYLKDTDRLDRVMFDKGLNLWVLDSFVYREQKPTIQETHLKLRSLAVNRHESNCTEQEFNAILKEWRKKVKNN